MLVELSSTNLRKFADLRLCLPAFFQASVDVVTGFSGCQKFGPFDENQGGENAAVGLVENIEKRFFAWVGKIGSAFFG